VTPFELLLFSVDAARVGAAAAAGVDGIVVDWERAGKRDRQAGADTEINQHTVEDLRRVRALFPRRVVCRINPAGPWTDEEVAAAVDGGADELLLPMVRTVDEVERVLGLVGSRCRLGILVETEEAVAAAPVLARLPISRAYVGLNDLAIDRRAPTIFAAVADGTVQRVREAFEVPFGFAGLTVPERGDPIPCRLLAGELARIGCSFSFLRRSFTRDVAWRALDHEVPRIRRMLDDAFSRPQAAVVRDRTELLHRLAALEPVVAEAASA
jgi:hypothetical protein